MDQTFSQFSDVVFDADIIGALKADYRRPQHIEDQIKEVSKLTIDELLERLKIKRAADLGYLRAETLVYLLCAARSKGHLDLEEPLAKRLAEICQYLIRKWTFSPPDDDKCDDIIGESICIMLGQIFDRKQQSYDFWEVNFFTALQRVFLACKKKNSLKQKDTDLFADIDNEEDHRQNFEDTLRADEKLTQAQTLEIKDILVRLPQKDRIIFILYHYEGLLQDEVAKLLGISDKTVRNRLKSASNFLQQFIAADKGALNG